MLLKDSSFLQVNYNLKYIVVRDVFMGLCQRSLRRKRKS